jgi:hypothetical protein
MKNRQKRGVQGVEDSWVRLRGLNPEDGIRASGLIGNELVATFGGESDGGGDDSKGTETLQSPAECAHDPGVVEKPADEEAPVVIEEICLVRKCQYRCTM